MGLKEDIVKFLKGHPAIHKLNFAFPGTRTYRVYPGAYRVDVADAINKEEIILKSAGKMSGGAGASYDLNYDALTFGSAFSTSNWRDQGFLIHECTHAHLDIQNFGKHSGHENEAVAYVAEALFLEASGSPPLGTESIRTVAHGIAKTILAGTYHIPAGDASSLVAEVRSHPHYATSVCYVSSGFNRSFIHNLLR